MRVSKESAVRAALNITTAINMFASTAFASPEGVYTTNRGPRLFAGTYCERLYQPYLGFLPGITKAKTIVEIYFRDGADDKGRQISLSVQPKGGPQYFIAFEQGSEGRSTELERTYELPLVSQRGDEIKVSPGQEIDVSVYDYRSALVLDSEIVQTPYCNILFP